MIASDCTLIIPCRGPDCAGLDSINDPHVYVIPNKRYGEAILEGIQKARTTYIATMDADGQHTLRDLQRLFWWITFHDLDMVIGHRPRADGGLRSVASCALNLPASIIAGRRVPDLGCGARVFRRDMALDLRPKLPEGFEFNSVLTTLALLRGYSVEWLRIPFRPRKSGKSHLVVADGFRTLQRLVTTR